MEDAIDKNCEELSYRLIVPTTEFDVERFTKDFKKISEDDEGWKGVVLGPRPGGKSPFHAHAFWRIDRRKAKETQIQVDFHRWKSKKKPIAEIYAEDVYSWTSNYLKPEKANIHVHAEFKFPLGSWLPKIMPLPMKVPYSGRTATLDGVSIEFTSDPSGVHGGWVIINKKHVTVQLFAFRPIEFKKFKIESDIEAFSAVAKGLVEEKLT